MFSNEFTSQLFDKYTLLTRLIVDVLRYKMCIPPIEHFQLHKCRFIFKNIFISDEKVRIFSV